MGGCLCLWITLSISYGSHSIVNFCQSFVPTDVERHSINKDPRTISTRILLTDLENFKRSQYIHPLRTGNWWLCRVLFLLIFPNILISQKRKVSFARTNAKLKEESWKGQSIAVITCRQLFSFPPIHSPSFSFSLLWEEVWRVSIVRGESNYFWHFVSLLYNFLMFLAICFISTTKNLPILEKKKSKNSWTSGTFKNSFQYWIIKLAKAKHCLQCLK